MTGTPGDVFLPAFLLPVMRMGSSLRVEEAVSPTLLHAIPTIQSIYRTWAKVSPRYQRYHAIEVEAECRSPSQLPTDRAVASFFSGGVDSFYTVLKHKEEIDALIYVEGFDVPLSNRPLQDDVVSAVRRAASELGKPLVVVSTNLRGFSDNHAHWEGYHGAALASVALLLSPQFHKVYIPGTLTYAHLVPLGSHPILDPLWSTEDVSIVHDGSEAARLDKIAEIASSSAARRSLRVCWINEDGPYNCGRCEKCLRTMVAMKALGVLGQFETVPQSIDLSRMRYEDLPFVRYTWEQSLVLLERSSGDRRLVRDLRRSLYGPRARVTRRAARYGRNVQHQAAGLLRGWAAAVQAPRKRKS